MSRPVRVVAPDEREVGQIEANRSRGRPLPHHNIEREILERGIEHFLDHAVQAMNLVDEENVALFKIREDCRQVARSLQICRSLIPASGGGGT